MIKKIGGCDGRDSTGTEREGNDALTLRRIFYAKRREINDCDRSLQSSECGNSHSKTR